MTSGADLLSDQLFQLNAFLWALEDMPPTGRTRPVLRNAGYYLVAIGRRVQVPAEDSVIAALERLTGSADRSPCRPDLWLRHREHPVQVIVELKARGFSRASSKNARQAVKLLLSAFDLAASLGEQTERRGHVLYGTVGTDAERQSATLKELADEVSAMGLPAAPTAVVGLSIEDEGVMLSSPTPSDLPDPTALALAAPTVVLRRDDDNDLRPLYFVPWMPGIEDSQDPELHADGLRELTARVLTQAMGHVGRARVPTTLTVHGTQLLSDATFSVFDRWHETNRNRFSEAAAKIVERALKKSQIEIRRHGGSRLEINLPSAETKDQAIKGLEQADPANAKKNLEATTQEHPKLFENFEVG